MSATLWEQPSQAPLKFPRDSSTILRRSSSVVSLIKKLMRFIPFPEYSARWRGDAAPHWWFPQAPAMITLRLLRFHCFAIMIAAIIALSQLLAWLRRHYYCHAYTVIVSLSWLLPWLRCRNYCHYYGKIKVTNVSRDDKMFMEEWTFFNDVFQFFKWCFLTFLNDVFKWFRNK